MTTADLYDPDTGTPLIGRWPLDMALQHERDDWRRIAEAGIAALRDAGLLPPDDAEARIEWGVRSVQHGTAAQHVLRYDSEAKADDMLDYRRHRAPAGCTDPHATKVRRTITTWGDGGMHITPWQTVEETP